MAYDTREEEVSRMSALSMASSAPTTGQDGPGSGRGPLERVTVNLTPRSSQALDSVVAITGDSKTDTINRAVQVYLFLEELATSGGVVYVRPSENSELERLKVF
jgi:hypothetical protein